MTTDPTTFAIPNVWGGIAKDAFQGAATPMTMSLPTGKPATWNDKPTWLEDTSLQGVMTDLFGTSQGVTVGELTFPESILYVDSFGMPLGNITGDLTTTGASAPYETACSQLNSTTGQGTTHTYEQWYGPTNTSGARLFTGLCFTEIVISWDVAKKFLTWSGKAACWASQGAASKPTDNQSSVVGIPSWKLLAGVGGPASGGTQVMTCASGKVTLSRQVKPQYTGSNTQNPYLMHRGAFTAKFDDLIFLAADETPYNLMRNNTRPQLQLIFDNGLSGTAHGALQIDAQSSSFRTSEADFGGDLVRWKTSGKCEATTTNAGASGGKSPIMVTLTNAIASGTYV